MKILILGGTGRTGRLAVNCALENGYEVTCLARNVNRIEKKDGLTIIDGSPLNEEDLTKAIAGCEVVISILNISRKSDFPWSGLRTPQHFLSDVMQQVISVAKSQNVKRIITCSAWGVSETRHDIPGWFRWFIDHSNIGVAYADHERQENILATSELDWTIVRPTGLTNSKAEQRILETYDNQPKPSLTISRQSVARYLVGCLRREDLIQKKVVISKA